MSCLIDPNVELLEYFDILLDKLTDENKICFEREILKNDNAVKALSLSL